MAMISWAETLSSTKPAPLVKAAGAAEAGAVVAASAGAVVEEEAEAGAAVAVGAEAGTVTAEIAAEAETAAGNRTVPLKNSNREPGSAQLRASRFFYFPPCSRE
jgi:hypothetical protein